VLERVGVVACIEPEDEMADGEGIVVVKGYAWSVGCVGAMGCSVGEDFAEKG
jgi:hypothetical protein